MCFVVSIPPSALKNSDPTGRIFMKSDIRVFFEKLSRKFKFHYNRTRIMDTLHEDQCNFRIIARLILLRMKTVSDKICTGIKTHFVFSKFLFSKIVPYMR